MNTTYVLLHLGDPSLHALEAIIFRRTIRRTFSKGRYMKYLQIYIIKDTMEYMSLSIGRTPIGSMWLKKCWKYFSKKVLATLPIQNSLQ
jgi:hypothetical protein